ncbi:LolA family protein [Crassaminicella profunda]|uniref:LolA family protein n=1 Tax=Crassaminicella profunda TaxID=1286698 RepID=UPI001CA673DA|nr:outer-membrane lipoprotein carrier protein LolA [Crassaminicella profunda]QZY55765.1 outer-membrane lipoprotein carrier protein LolA [Crassaminicella profunda]
MRSRRIIWIILLIMFIVGCEPKTEQELFYKAQKKLNKMESYSCQVEIISTGNKNPEKHTMKQWFKKPNKYKLEVIGPKDSKGKMIIGNGNKAWIYHPGIEQTWMMEEFLNSEEQNMFLGYFIRNSLNSEQVKGSIEKLEKKEYIKIDTDIPGNHVYYHKERLWIDLDALEPYLLEVFDIKGEKRIEIKYSDFQYNPKLGDEMFLMTK